MDRREVFGALGATVVGLAGLEAPAQDKGAPDKASTHTRRHFQKCAKLCADCMTQCEANFRHCADLVADGRKDHARAMHLSNDCAELCAMAARLAARMSPLAFPTAEACAKACDSCATECEKHTSEEQMRTCAQACRDCAKECRTMISHIGHEHGHDHKKP